MIFINNLLKTLGFLMGLAIFLVILSIFIAPINNYSNNTNFKKISGDTNSNNVISVINLNGIILNNQDDIFSYPGVISVNKVSELLDELKEIKPKVLLININSPGGTVSASFDLYKKVKKFKKDNKVKVYFFTNQVMASGAYLMANSGDKIIANYGSLIGSIGVSGPDWIYYNKPKTISSGFFGQTIETENGIEIFSQNAGKSKDLYNRFRKPTKKEINHLKKIVDNIYNDFTNIVTQNRKIESFELKNNIGALIYNSKLAKENFLIDNVMNYEDLIQSIIKDLKLKDFRIIENIKTNNRLEKYLLSFKKNDMSIFCSEIKTNFLSMSPLNSINC